VSWVSLEFMNIESDTWKHFIWTVFLFLFFWIKKVCLFEGAIT